MPRSHMALMGYVGEAIVEYWLRWKYPVKDGFKIVSQIRPKAVPASGGPYLDFGVCRDGHIQYVYEVKGQDFIIDRSFAINRSLVYIWTANNDLGNFLSQDGDSFAAEDGLRALLVLLAPPNKDGMKKIGRENLKNVILFADIWEELGSLLTADQILRNLEADLHVIIDIFKNPTAGRRLLPRFLKVRDSMQQN